jgi:hypothetical protein
MKSRPPPPLDGTEWMTLDAAYRLGHAHTGSVDFTITDLQNALEAGLVRAKIRGRSGDGQDEHGAFPPELWKSFALKAKWSQASDDAAPVVVGLQLVRRGKLIFRYQHFVIYVWEPDVRKLWPTGRAPVQKPEAPTRSRQPEQERQQDKPAGGRNPHPDRAAILENYRQRRTRRERNAAKNTAQWVETEVAEGRLTEVVHPDTIRAWDREEKPGPEKKNRMK